MPYRGIFTPGKRGAPGTSRIFRITVYNFPPF